MSRSGSRQGASMMTATFGDQARHYLRHHRDMAIESLRRLVDKPVPSFLTALVLAISLALPAGLFMVLKNLQTVGENWADTQAKMSVFLKESVADHDAERLMSQVAQRQDVGHVDYVSRDQGLADFRKWSGMGDVLAGLDKNPLPAVLIVQPRDTSAEGANAVKRSLQALPQVETVQLDADWIQRLQALIYLVQRLVTALAATLAVTVLLVIGNTIRLAIESRRDEIVVVKLVGGTDGFVRRPFLYTGFWYGFIGAFMALVMVESFTAWIEGPAAELARLYGSEFKWQGLSLVEGLLVQGASVLLGLLGAVVAVAQHLRDIEPHESI